MISENQIEFLDALVEIRKEFPGARFALVASDAGIGQIQDFKKRVVELDLSDGVLWTGRLSKEEMLSFYADIDIAVSTHRNEGFGIWLLEASCHGQACRGIQRGRRARSIGRLSRGGARKQRVKGNGR